MRIALSITLLLVACSDKPQPNTPRESVRAFGAALAEFDYEAIRPHVVGDDLDLEFLRAFFEHGNTAFELKAKIIEAYGEEGWEQFNDNEGTRLSLVRNRNLDRFDGVRYEFDGDRAIGTMPNESQKLHLERKNGRWSVRLRETMGLPEDELRRQIVELRADTAAFRAALARVGKDGVTPDVLDAEIAATALDR